MTLAPTHLQVDAGGDAFPVTSAAPRLSWRPASLEPATEGYVLEARIDGIALAPQDVAGEVLAVAWPWPPLASRRAVEWRVRPAGTEDWSEWHTFESGLLDHDWSADWIASPLTADSPRGALPAHVFRATLDVATPVTRARLYATALGVYEASINGARVGTTELAPGTSSYDLTLYAQAYDVTDAVVQGGNTITITLSAGWYLGQVGAFRIPAEWGDTPGVRAELHLELADGSTQVVATGADWTCASSPIIAADLMDGQRTDLTRTAEVAAPVRVGAVAAPPIAWSPAPPVRVVETRAAEHATRIDDETWVLDFGQNASGWVALADLGPAGAVTRIDYGEFAAPGGDLLMSHLDSHRPGEPTRSFMQRDTAVSDGSGGRFEPRHTVHGFQYARVHRTGGPLDPSTVTMRVVQTDLSRTGAFECSDADLNRLHEIADWSFRGNAVDVPTDCPTRERLAWTGDYQVFAPTATRLYDVAGFTRKWLRAVRDDQLPDGRIANFSPDGRRIKAKLDDQFAMMTGSAGWGDAVVLVPWEMYEAYGDATVLAENWDAMVGWVEWALGNASTARHHSRMQRSPEAAPHEQYLWDGSFHWGEWTEPMPRNDDGSRANPIQDNPMQWFMADKGEVGTAYLYLSTSTLARIAAVLGHGDDARRYEDLAGKVLTAWRTEFLAADGRTVGDTQAGYVRALSFGLIPDEHMDAAADRLVELIHAADDHLTTGFLATGRLLPVLADAGHADVARTLLYQRTEPSWLNMVDRGATTIWEDWDGIDRDGVPHESLNHYSKGAVVRFFHTHVLGLRQEPGSAGWERYVVAPVPLDGLEWARGHHDTPRGRISVEWRIVDGALEVTVDAPAAGHGTVVMPDGGVTPLDPGTTVVRGAVAAPAPAV
ncbi:family 78 glycoside hydrolase catalytic domain [Demequina phytophila]|uniref:family 78 glycoside hydrolase catalytic domain n=1 Tax=Demequina phytophila TaxID=1638981 RepID=UPI0007805E31|nr:family 78 glycoside hydrolase catalytic domain [Demequina phytophila]